MLLKEQKIAKDDTFMMAPITMLSPEGDEGEDEDSSDLDDEDFEDLAEDRDDFHEMELENDIFDPDDDDHLPDEDI